MTRKIILQNYPHYVGVSRIKEVVPPNLLKQENVFLIPREPEHPSRGKTILFRRLSIYWSEPRLTD